MRKFVPQSRSVQAGFSLLEMLLALTLFSVVMGLLFSVLQNSQKAWGHASSQLEQFEEARGAFETISRRLTDAVLNPYWGYEFPDGDTSKTPIGFSRQSELHFVCGPASGGASPVIDSDFPPSHAIFFHGPFGVNNQTNWVGFTTLLNGWGYYLDYVDIGKERPGFLPETFNTTGSRFRLMELRIPSEELSTYKFPETVKSGDWYKEAIKDGKSSFLAGNVVAMIITPEASDGALSHPTDIAPEYHYDTLAFLGSGKSYAVQRSRHQLPPLLRFTMVVLDEASAIKLSEQSGSAFPDLGLDELFVDAKKYTSDLTEFENQLIKKELKYRIFSTMIRLRNARWSEDPPL